MTTASPGAGIIGIDESGKGDYFGPLVVAGAYVTPDQEARLRDLGVRDSKACSDKRAHTLAAHIRTLCPTTLVTIGPERYNSLYASLKNLNVLLAWGHARAIENLLETVTCERVIADQFGNDNSLTKNCPPDRSAENDSQSRPISTSSSFKSHAPNRRWPWPQPRWSPGRNSCAACRI